MGRFRIPCRAGGKDVCASLEKIFTGDYRIRKRMLLQCTVDRSGKRISDSTALNEAVISPFVPVAVNLHKIKH